MKSDTTFHQQIQFGRKTIGIGNPCYIVAEIGVNFNGSLDLAKKSIDAAASAGADAVKFQTFKADEFVSDKNLTYTYKTSEGKTITETQYEMFKRLELPDAWHKELQTYSNSKNVDFFSSVADVSAVELLSSLHVPALKMASEDLINISLLDKVAQKKMPVILSTGMGDLEEIEEAVGIFKKNGHQDLIVLHCTSSYPTPLSSCNALKIPSLRDRFQLPVGFSDHTEGYEAAVVAVSLGACIVEKHFTTDKTLPGPDHKMSCNPSEFKTMVDAIRTAEKILGSGKIAFDEIEETGRKFFRRSIVAKSNIEKGTTITLDMLSYKRPGTGLKPGQRNLLIGKKAKRAIQSDEQITSEDVA